jgi:hypothetical protein
MILTLNFLKVINKNRTAIGYWIFLDIRAQLKVAVVAMYVVVMCQTMYQFFLLIVHH